MWDLKTIRKVNAEAGNSRMEKMTPEDLFEKAKNELEKLEETKANLEKWQKTAEKQKEKDAQEQAEARKKHIARRYPEALQKSAEIFAWISGLFRDETKCSVLQKHFPQSFDLFYYGHYGFEINWNFPGEIFWERGRRFRYDNSTYGGVAQKPEDIAWFDPELVDGFHAHLHTGEIWKNLEVKIAEEVRRVSEVLEEKRNKG